MHQGGCCSSLYFLVIAEILALSIRSNETIQGISIRDIRNILNQFADDMDVFSLNKESSIRAIYGELERFRSQSGFTVSYEKTTLYRIGSLRHSSAQLYNMDQFVWSNEDIKVLGVQIAHEDILSKNYSSMVEKVRTILEAWYNRGLSLLGKVQVVNTLVASLFIHKMMVLPMIPTTIVKNIDNVIRSFLWNGKKAKIAYTILQNTKEQGGVGLVNIERRDKALKATWPQILNSEKDYQQVVFEVMRCQCLGEDIWRCSLLPEDVASLKIKSQFWEDVLKSWCEYNFHHDRRVENQLIWLNSEIRIAGKPFFWKDAFQRGLKYVYQLFDKGNFKAQEQLYQEFGVSMLRHNSLKLAIPGKWKAFFMETQVSEYLPLPPHNLDRCIGGGMPHLASRIYRYFTGDITMIHYKYVKWEKDLREEICGDIWEFGKLHKNIFKVTNVPKLRSFQYRLIQRGIVTNVQLCEWRIIPSNLCTFCHQEVETMLHYSFYVQKYSWFGLPFRGIVRQDSKLEY